MAALSAPVAHAQTILSGQYDYDPTSLFPDYGYYTNEQGGSYTVTATATFNNAPGVGLYLGNPDAPVIANIYGGTFDNDNAIGLFAASASVDIFGVSFDNTSIDVETSNNSVVNIYGGNFGYTNQTANLIAVQGTIILYGSDFTQNGVALPYGTLSPGAGSFSGKLQNDSVVQTFSYQTAASQQEGIVLAPPIPPAVPETSSFALLGLGLLPLGILVRRRVRK